MRFPTSPDREGGDAATGEFIGFYDAWLNHGLGWGQEVMSACFRAQTLTHDVQYMTLYHLCIIYMSL